MKGLAKAILKIASAGIVDAVVNIFKGLRRGEPPRAFLKDIVILAISLTVNCVIIVTVQQIGWDETVKMIIDIIDFNYGKQ